MDMKHRQQGITAIGFIIIASLVAMIGYGAVRLIPVYLTQMNIVKLMKDIKAEYDGTGPSQARLMAAIGKQLDVDACLLYTSDAADERSSVDLGGRRIIKKNKTTKKKNKQKYQAKMT